jgi:hypothetical protein
MTVGLSMGGHGGEAKGGRFFFFKEHAFVELALAARGLVTVGTARFAAARIFHHPAGPPRTLAIVQAIKLESGRYRAFAEKVD